DSRRHRSAARRSATRSAAKSFAGGPAPAFVPDLDHDVDGQVVEGDAQLERILRIARREVEARVSPALVTARSADTTMATPASGDCRRDSNETVIERPGVARP